MSDLHKDAQRQAQAESLLRSELLMGGYEEIERKLIASWKATRSDQTKERERFWDMVQANMMHKALLHSAVTNGKLAQREIDDIARLGERKKIFGVV